MRSPLFTHKHSLPTSSLKGRVRAASTEKFWFPFHLLLKAAGLQKAIWSGGEREEIGKKREWGKKMEHTTVLFVATVREKKKKKAAFRFTSTSLLSPPPFSILFFRRKRCVSAGAWNCIRCVRELERVTAQDLSTAGVEKRQISSSRQRVKSPWMQESSWRLFGKNLFRLVVIEWKVLYLCLLCSHPLLQASFFLKPIRSKQTGQTLAVSKKIIHKWNCQAGREWWWCSRKEEEVGGGEE